jgi:DNA-binding transcriptional LysR family regulator
LFRIGLPDGAEVMLGPALLAHLCETAPGIRLRLQSADQLFDALDADHIDLGIGFGPLPEGQTHHKRRLLAADTYLCMFNAARLGLLPPISLEDYVRLPHVLTSLRTGEQGVVDEALAKLGLRRTVAVTTQRFTVVPFLVAGAPVITTMPARIARFFAASLGLSLSPAPLELPEPVAALVWHASYDHDPAHIWLRQTVLRIAADIGWRRDAV